MCSRLVCVLRAVVWGMACSVAVCGQTPAVEQSANQPGYTLHVATHLVLTDVTVLDKHGNPVHGLSQSAFQIFDNGKPQEIASFSEHSGNENPPPAAPSGAGEFTNSFLQHPPAAFNVLLLDVTTIHIADQMYLADQLRKFVESLPPGELLAIYTRAGDAVVLLQNFTSDHTLLRAAISKAVPHLQQPGSWAASDLDTLQQMVLSLRPYPGRKNLIWFSGGSNLALLADDPQFPIFINMRPIYDELEATRIAVYPVDARGLTIGEPGAMVWQQMMMQDTARATGGRAFYNNNGLKQIAARIVDDGAQFYTLTYNPHEEKFDNKWHKVKVVVKADGESYDLSYRRGYYDDGSNVTPGSGGRTPLRADGSTSRQGPDVLKAPILFSATVLPAASVPPSPKTIVAAPPGKNQATYNIHYALPASGFVQHTRDERPQVEVGTGVLGVNRLGAHVARQVETVRIGIDPEKFRDHPNGIIGLDQQINLPKGEDFLYIMVWDEDSGRFGIVQAPLMVPKPAK